MCPQDGTNRTYKASRKIARIALGDRTICQLLKSLNIQGATGLGQQILAAFALSGAHGAVLHESGTEPAKIHGYEHDTSSEEAVKSAWDKIVSDFGKVDILVTNAGITGGAPAEDYTFEGFKTMINVNLNGTLFARTAGKCTTKNGVKSKMLIVSSMSESISKAASAHLMKSIAAEWALYGICVNALSPGYIQTEANAGEEMGKLSKKWTKYISTARIAKPEEFRGTSVWLVSEASSYVTGSEIIVDGGYYIW
ncbi:NAD(P)-binding protein [Lentithecium fluviatile CBS 122367]|uniref:NAD(P)-binding protein n=1 Tax=Lentithecium fluviatile CBS 122367 TaxID=1168545 RepID=A0A6G1IG88_9PLEO|nr:NAD(P)-binding protein [Lentithecium fluviatile CBS 122367]